VARLFPATGELQPDIAGVTAAMAERESAGAKAFLGNVFPAGFLGDGVDFNGPEVHASEIPASEGPPLGSDVAGLRLAMGFQLDCESRRMLTPDSFGHYGFGGSVGIADPGLTAGFGYVPDQLRGGAGGDVRPRRLMKEVSRLPGDRSDQGRTI
jgi:hypothetical protein